MLRCNKRISEYEKIPGNDQNNQKFLQMSKDDFRNIWNMFITVEGGILKSTNKYAASALHAKALTVSKSFYPSNSKSFVAATIDKLLKRIQICCSVGDDWTNSLLDHATMSWCTVSERLRAL